MFEVSIYDFDDNDDCQIPHPLPPHIHTTTKHTDTPSPAALPPVASVFPQIFTSTNPGAVRGGVRRPSAASGKGARHKLQREPLSALDITNQLEAPATTPAIFKKKRPDLVKSIFSE
jgi:hypothetical protein